MKLLLRLAAEGLSFAAVVDFADDVLSFAELRSLTSCYCSSFSFFSWKGEGDL